MSISDVLASTKELRLKAEKLSDAADEAWAKVREMDAYIDACKGNRVELERVASYLTSARDAACQAADYADELI